MGIIITTSSLELSGSCELNHNMFMEKFNVPGRPWYSGSKEWCHLERGVVYEYTGSFVEQQGIEWAAPTFGMTCSFHRTETTSSIIIC